MKKENVLVKCQITNKKIALKQAVPGVMIRPGVLEFIKQEHPKFSTDGYISKEKLKKYTKQYIEGIIETERGELSNLDKEVVKSLVNQESIVKNIDAQIDKKITVSERISDKISAFGGSWSFIIIFASILIIWVAINSYLFLARPFDPYPFILLNLFLSCLAAVQAPIIMMSQNRKESKDRARSENDYKVNLKAELEIRHLHEKLDNLTLNQWERLLEIQEMQIDMMSDLTKNQLGKKSIRKKSKKK